ncbi:MAG: hypothetical protein GY787_24860 [Alteromonadales bacterium]|nr:hypothetical protein [Alteromonadales bacterium]
MSYSPTELQEMVLNGTPEQKAEARGILEGVVNNNVPTESPAENPTQPVDGTPVQEVQVPVQPVQEVVQPQAPQQPVQPEVAPQQQYFTTAYQGKEEKFEDTDGFLNRKDLNGVKNMAAHQMKHIEKLNGQLTAQQHEAQTAIELANNEKAELQRKLDEMNAKLAQPQVQQPVQPQTQQYQPVDQAQVNGYNQNYAQPQYQQNPSNGFTPLPEDTMEWEGQQVGAINNGLSKIGSIESQVAELKKAQDEFNAKNAELEKQRQAQLEQEQAEASRKAFVNDVNGFITSHEKYKVLGNDIDNYDSKAGEWMTSLASANNVRPPLVQTKEALDEYERKRTEVARLYMEGNPMVTTSAGHLQEPQGIREYFEVSQLINKQNNEYQTYDINGNPRRMSLQEVWALENMKNGGFQNAMNSVRDQAQQQGAQAMANVQGDIANHAVNLSDTANQSTPNNGITKSSMEELRQILNQNPVELMRDPEKKKQYDAAVLQINSMTGN